MNRINLLNDIRKPTIATKKQPPSQIEAPKTEESAIQTDEENEGEESWRDKFVKSLEKRFESHDFELKPPSIKRESRMRRSYSQRAMQNLARSREAEITPHDRLLNEIRNFKFNSPSTERTGSGLQKSRSMLNHRISEESFLSGGSTSNEQIMKTSTTSKDSKETIVSPKKSTPPKKKPTPLKSEIVSPVLPENTEVKKVEKKTEDDAEIPVEVFDLDKVIDDAIAATTNVAERGEEPDVYFDTKSTQNIPESPLKTVPSSQDVAPKS